ncbi:MAG: bifunctional serine/threonine-protein kinase/formylglycine-generating enzyme family protein [Candidatus Competibacter sp.]|nr:bifunctional serine/threonine-protein kinase/formylglycine-generating enzyme family protein [Candidatus Competibacter sp.]
MAAPSTNMCSGCFQPREGGENATCARCGYNPNAPRSLSLLPVRTQLQQYAIGEKLGQGGFGITYRGFDLKLRMEVAIKEYYPSDFVGRSSDRKTLVLLSPENGELFDYGLRAFVGEARTLAQLKHPNVARVHNLFGMNGTAYLVMDYYEGETLHDYLARQPGRKLPWRLAVNLMLPVLDGLRTVHDSGFMHRDVKPRNIYRTHQGQIILLDFGAARQVVGDHSRSMAIYSSGYAAYEQHVQHGQGPWTDVYGAAATLYFSLTAQVPPPASERKQCDTLKPVRHFSPDSPPALDNILRHALAVEPDHRLQSVAEFEQRLRAVLRQEEKLSAEAKRGKPPFPGPSLKPRTWAMTGFLLLAVTVAGLFWIFSPPSVITPAPPAPKPVEPAPPPVVAPPPIPPAAEPAPQIPPSPLATAGQVFHDRLRDGGQGPAMVVIPAGKFQMGSPEGEAGRDADERQHSVKIEHPFAVGQYEVTVGEFRRFVETSGYKTDAERNAGGNDGCFVAYREGNEWNDGYRAGYSWWNPNFKQGDAHPVACVSWNDAMAYAKWLSRQTGQKYRLPTEAEWEYAARAGTTTVRYWGDDPDQACRYANVADQTAKKTFPNWTVHACDDRHVHTAPVGSFQPNAWMLHDMLGNVWEWTCSTYDENYGGAERECARDDATGTRAVRGGSWDDVPAWVRSALRYGDSPTLRYGNMGFRLAR